jgi:hypothetical protein
MRINDGLATVGSGTGVAALALQNHWILASFVLVLGTAVSLVVWDVRRAGGLGAWAQELLLAVGDWHEFLTRRKRRRDLWRTQHLRERNKRRRMRRGRRKRNKRHVE